MESPQALTSGEAAQRPAVAGFWPRCAAFLVDGLVLGMAGLLVGLLFERSLVELGAWGRLIGFVVALCYFGSLNGPLGAGQTLGKRALGLKVVRRDGTALSAWRGVLRFALTGSAWFLNGAQLPDRVMHSAWLYPMSIVIFGVGLCELYLYVFNRRSRQTLHDLMVDSIVVKAGVQAPPPAPLWRPHLAVCALLFLASALAPYGLQGLAAGETFAPIIAIQDAVQAVPWVSRAGVFKGQSYVTSSQHEAVTTSYLTINALVRDSDVDNADRAAQLAKLALVADPSARSLNALQVTLTYGFDIGIASSWRSKQHVHSPADWLAR
jgi:uncharacterized RDD family membrane protein YckC